ncbi:MAG: VWA domain-containing protein [Vicinamibacterales bacterium]
MGEAAATLTSLNLDTFQFAEPQLLWLLTVPAVLLVLWLRRLIGGRGERKRMLNARLTPYRERFSRLGDAPFWLGLTIAATLLIVALAQPQVVASFVRTSGADIVVLLDSSASMHVTDVPANRWQRSIGFLRVLGDSLSWQNDRIALTVFAHIAAPQVRLTRDPNTFFFFLDHLSRLPPFRLEDDTTWDTNIALGIAWGLRVIEKDEQVRGPSQNARLFVLITDGQAWSGTVEESIANAKKAGVPIFVIGVGTERGGIIPDPKRTDGDGSAPVYSRLDRASLRTIAAAGNGQYFEMDRGSDVDLANRVIDSARRRATESRTEPIMQDVYWPFLFAAAVAALAGCLFVRNRTALVLQLIGVGATALVIGAALR